MKKLFLALVAAFAVTANVSAKELTIQNDFGSDISVKITYCRGTKVTKFVHFNHELNLSLEEMVEAVIDLAKTKKIRLQEMVIESNKEIIKIVFKDNKIKLPATIVIKEDGVFNNGVKFEEHKDRKVTKKAVVAALAKKQLEVAEVEVTAAA